MKMQLMKRPVVISIASLLMILALAGGVLWWNQQRPDEFTGPIQTDLTLDQTDYLIGDEMHLTLTIWTEPGYQVEAPTITPPEGVELVEKETGELEQRRDYAKYIDRYTFQSFEPGRYQLSEIKVSYTSLAGEEQELTLEGPTLTVKSLLTEESSDIRGLKPVAEPPQRNLLYYLLAGVMLLAIVGYLIYRWMRSKWGEEVAEEVEPPVLAHERAYQRLQELEQSDYLEKGEITGYFTVLSQILREYIENRFGVKAQEMTTQEFLTDALQSVAMTVEHQELLREFMVKGDLVKYARHIPDYQQIEGAFGSAKQFVDETKVTEEMLARQRELAREQEEQMAMMLEEEAQSLGDTGQCGPATFDLSQPAVEAEHAQKVDPEMIGEQVDSSFSEEKDDVVSAPIDVTGHDELDSLTTQPSEQTDEVSNADQTEKGGDTDGPKSDL